MATLTGIISSGSTADEIGGPFISLPSLFYLTPNVNFGTKEYLRGGYFKTYSSDYSDFLNKVSKLVLYINVDANANVLLTNANSTRNWANSLNLNVSSGTVNAKLEKSNTDFIMIQYVVDSGGQGYNVSSRSIVFKYGPNIAQLATANANSTPTRGYGLSTYDGGALVHGSGFYDSLSYNGRVIVVGGSIGFDAEANATFGAPYMDINLLRCNGVVLQTNTNSFSIFNAAISSVNVSIRSQIGAFAGANTLSTGFMYQAIASNGNHIVVCSRIIAQSNAHILTSLNGTSWTGRTMSGAPANTDFARVTYSNAANCYIFVTESGNVFTSTDGFTLTSRTAPITTANSRVVQVYGQSAYSATSLTNTFILISSNTLYQTSNGVTFRAIDMDLVANLSIFKGQNNQNNMSIVWANNRFVISSNSGRTVFSDDDGVTWKIDNTRYNQNVLNTEPGYINFMHQTVHDNSIYCTVKSTTNVIPLNVTSSLYQATPHIFGFPDTSSTSWARIK